MKNIFVAFIFTFFANIANAENTLEDAQIAYVNNDYKKAVEIYSELASKGNAQAQRKLGNMYENGDGVEKNFIKAIKFYRLAAAQNKDKLQNKNDTQKLFNLLYLYAGILISVLLAGKNKGGRLELVITSLLSLILLFFSINFPAESPLKFLFILAFIIPSYSIARRLNAINRNKWSALWCFTGIYSFYKTYELIFDNDYNNERMLEKEKNIYSHVYYVESLYGFILALLIIVFVIGLIFIRII